MRAVPAWLVHGIVIFVVVCASIIGEAVVSLFLHIDPPSLALVFVACLVAGWATSLMVRRKPDALPSRFQIGDSVMYEGEQAKVEGVAFAYGAVTYTLRTAAGLYRPEVGSLDVQPLGATP